MRMEQEQNKVQKRFTDITEHNTNLDINPPSKLPIFIQPERDQTVKLNIGLCMLTLVLRSLPIVLFFTATDNKVLGFTLVLIAASVDFWILKNIGGRQLVGMIWWMKVNVQNGDQEWVFHSNEGQSISKINEGIFWGSILLGNVFWGICTLLCIILSSLFWISLCIFCMLLGALNFVCFIKCQGEHRQKIRELADKVGLASAHSLVDY